MFSKLRESVKSLPSENELEAMEPQRKICIYAPVIITVCSIIKAICPFTSVRIALIGAIAVLNQLCPLKT